MNEPTQQTPAAAPGASFVLHVPGDVPAGGERVGGTDALPVYEFSCRPIRVGGRYVAVNQKTGERQVLHATPERVDRWLNAVGRYIGKGNRVPVVVRHKVDPETTKGHVVNFSRGSDGWVHGRFRVVGERNREIAACNEVSLGIKSLTDGEGEFYPDTFEHLSLTSQPVVPGQGGTVQLSQDGDGDEPNVYTLSRDDAGAAPSPPLERSDVMPLSPELRARALVHARDPKRPLTPEQEAALDDEMLLSRALDEADALRADMKVAKGEILLAREALGLPTEADSPVTIAAEVGKTVEALNLAREESAGGDDDAEPANAELLFERRLRVVEKPCKFTPASMKPLLALALGTSEHPNAVMLSREPGATDCTAALLIDALNKLELAPAPGERTGRAIDRAAAYANLSREGGGEPSPEKAVKDTVQKTLDSRYKGTADAMRAKASA